MSMIIICIIFSLLALSNPFQYLCKSTSWSKQPRIYLNEREVLTRTAHNFSMIVDPTDQVVSKSILDTGSWETSLLTLIAALVSPNHSVLNIGSQSGMEAVLMGKLVGEGGLLTVFEPYSVSYKILVKNLQINGLSHISRAFKLGAGEKEGTLALWIDETNTGGTTFIKEADSRGMEEVEVRRVDDVVGEDKFDFVLMDTEKTEIEVLNGMRKVLQRSISVIVLLEWEYLENPQKDEESTRMTLEWLREAGYRWYRYSHHNDPCKLGSISELVIEQLLKIVREDLLLVGREADISKLI